MRALRPGEAAPHEQRSYLGLRVDFCGPAIIGLTALFAASGDLLPEQDEGESGGRAPDVATAAAGTPCGADADTASRSTDGSASGDDGSDDGKGGEERQRGSGSGLGMTWQQDAVALTECHLWWVWPCMAACPASLTGEATVPKIQCP